MKRFNDFAKMIQRMISLALEFFKFAVMRRPDHKFRDQWRKADSALQPPFTYIRCPLFLHFERFLLTGNPFLRYTYMDLRIFFCICLLLNFLSVLTYASFFPSLGRLRPISPVLHDLITRESSGDEFFFIQSTIYHGDETKERRTEEYYQLWSNSTSVHRP